MERYNRFFLATGTAVLVIMSGCTTVNKDLNSINPVYPSDVNIKFSAGTFLTALTSPLYDLNLLRHEIPDILPQSKELYTLPETVSCDTLQEKINGLSDVLGDDPAFHGVQTPRAGRLLTLDIDREISDSFSSLVPYRDYLRRLSGAKKRNQRHQAALFRGHLQRAHLHGKAAQMQCPISQPPNMNVPVVLVDHSTTHGFKTIHRPVPTYPAACARQQHTHAETASVRYDIRPDGRTQNVTIATSTNNCINRATANAIKNWRFEPIILDGQARHVTANTVTVTFLSKSDKPIFAAYVREDTRDHLAAATPPPRSTVPTRRSALVAQANDASSASPSAKQILAKRFSFKIIPLPRIKPKTFPNIPDADMPEEDTNTGQAIAMAANSQNIDVSQTTGEHFPIAVTISGPISNRYRTRPIAAPSRYRLIRLSAL